MTQPKLPSIYDRPITGHGGAKYLRRIRPAVPGGGEPIQIDVYCVIDAFDIRCPALQHALKKILACGQRGKGTRIDDIHGVFDAMWRALELARQDEADARERSATELAELQRRDVVLAQMQAAPPAIVRPAFACPRCLAPLTADCDQCPHCGKDDPDSDGGEL